jgi:hypothetical protein
LRIQNFNPQKLIYSDIASAMGEITFLLDMMKENLEENFSAFQKDTEDNDSHNDMMNIDNMPATLEELAQIKSINNNRIIRIN